jgi:hypothetical protein
MSQKYSDSENCRLELKFAKQTGVPIVPVMIQPGFKPVGWLGLLTAGSLWTPLYDQASFEENVQSLLRQIKLAVVSTAEALGDAASHFSADDAAAHFSAEELRDELCRLEKLDTSCNDTAGAVDQEERGKAMVPAAVPELPHGLLITGSMEELLHQLTATDGCTRIGIFILIPFSKPTLLGTSSEI